jgi:hypothetical protein
MNANTPNNQDSEYDMDEMSSEQKVFLVLAAILILYLGYKSITWLASSPETATAVVVAEAITNNSSKMTAAGIASLLNH